MRTSHRLAFRAPWLYWIDKAANAKYILFAFRNDLFHLLIQIAPRIRISHKTNPGEVKMTHRAFILIFLCSSLFIGEMPAQIKQVEAKNISVTLVESPLKNGEMQLWLDCALPQLAKRSRIHYATLELRERSAMKLVKKDTVLVPESAGLRYIGDGTLRLTLRAAAENTKPGWADVDVSSGSKLDSLRALAFPVVAQSELPNEKDKYAASQRTKNNNPGVVFDVTRLLQQATGKGRSAIKLLVTGASGSKQDFHQRKATFTPASIESMLKVNYVE